LTRFSIKLDGIDINKMVEEIWSNNEDELSSLAQR